ncbi:P-loop containing nucleoside triphosphate hydrolase protein [Hypoxylon argillaceum]|nr:P-loop containing nucleoside triphosphate hydrolase protein [Hypoxylon argillaceum]
MSGLGKTEIAVHYIHTRKNQFEAIFWIDSDSREKLDAGFQDIAIKLGLQDDVVVVLNDDPAATREVVKAWLANPARQLALDLPEQRTDVNWLIVFDNADEPDILSDFWPSESSGAILVTSRRPLATQASYTGSSGIDLSPMPSEEAGRLLQKTADLESDPGCLDTCISIAERLGGLPLAIVQMAHQIRHKHLSLTKFVEYYDQDTGKFHEASIPGLTKQQTVASIWNIEALPLPAVALLRVLSVLDSDVTYEDVLTSGAGKVALEHYPKTKDDYVEAREALVKSSLVIKNTELGFLKTHRLVQDVVRHKLETGELRAVYNAAVVLVSDVWEFSDETNLSRADRLRKVQRHFPQVAMFKSVLEHEGVGKLKPEIAVAALFNEVSWGYILRPRGYGLRDGAAFVALSLQLLQADIMNEDENLHSKLLADAYRFQGITAVYMDTDLAVPSCTEWISLLVQRIQKYQSQVDIKILPIAYNELGMALVRVPDPSAAVKSWVMSCESLLQVTKPGDLPFPFPWTHRALVTAYSGDPDFGYGLLFPILQAREAILGKNDTETIEGASALRVTTGEHSAATTQAFYRLARGHYEHEKYREASDLLRKCVAFAGDVPWYKAEAARARWKLGHTLQALKGRENEEEARELLGKAMGLRHELDPDDEREEPELSDDDWDKLVYYYYR